MELNHDQINVGPKYHLDLTSNNGPNIAIK